MRLSVRLIVYYFVSVTQSFPARLFDSSNPASSRTRFHTHQLQRQHPLQKLNSPGPPTSFPYPPEDPHGTPRKRMRPESAVSIRLLQDHSLSTCRPVPSSLRSAVTRLRASFPLSKVTGFRIKAYKNARKSVTVPEFSICCGWETLFGTLPLKLRGTWVSWFGMGAISS